MLTQGSYVRQHLAISFGGLTCEKPRRKSEGILSHGSLARYFLGGIQMGKTMELTALMGTIQKILIWTVRLIRVSWE